MEGNNIHHGSHTTTRVDTRSMRGERVTLLHKGKSRMMLDNYRGIAIGSNLGKVFTRILISRIQARAEREGLLGEMHNGFRKGRSTNDNLFVISHIMEKAQRAGTKGKGLFMVFIDLRKAYDRVWREGVWEVLDNMKLGKKLIRILIKLYQGHCRRVLTVGGLTEWILCKIGMKQGCVLSPILFALFVAELEKCIKQLGVGAGIGGGEKLGGGVTICRRSCTASRKRGRSEKISNSHK